jgi:hypothetical protein
LGNRPDRSPRDSAANTDAVGASIAVGRTDTWRANVTRSTGLIATGINDSDTRRPDTDPRGNPHTRGTDTGSRHRACHTSFGYADRLAVHNGSCGHGYGTQAQGKH